MKKSALIVIDVQRALFASVPGPADATAVVARINALAFRARATAAPVVFVQHERAGTPLQFGSPGWALAEDLEVASQDHRIRKTTPDSFLRTELEGLLASQGISQVVLCGYATEFCVDTTTRRAAALGYDVLLAADAHTTHDKPHATAAQIRAHHNATLPDIVSFGSTIRALGAADIQFVGNA